VIYDYKEELWFKKLKNICFPSYNDPRDCISEILCKHKAKLLSIINSEDKKANLFLGYQKGNYCNISYSSKA